MDISSLSRKKLFPLLVWLVILFFGCSISPENRTDILSADRSASIVPDYSGIVIPYNIAPMNFRVKESGEEFFVCIKSKRGDEIKVNSKSGIIQIPQGKWESLLKENIGAELIIDVFVKSQDGRWTRYKSIVNQIANDPIDSYIVYRRFKPLFNIYKNMGIFQRHLGSFDEHTVYHNRLAEENCVNCHNFWKNGVDRWLLHMRGGVTTSMLLVTDEKVQKIDTKTKFNGPVAYPAWHPSGDLIAFSVSKLILFFHQVGECRDVLDQYSDIVVYDIHMNTIVTAPQISSPDRLEIWPEWSPDGKTLYFCSAPKIEEFENLKKQGELAYDEIKYDLMRITYDPINRTWGKVEVVIQSAKLGLSITEPRISPDGRFLLFTAAEYSQFPSYIQSADLYLLDLKTNKWKKLEVNSDKVDSFHSWSSNGRWFVFASKREDGLFTRLYFSSIDSLGNVTKQFILPQKDPSFYDTYLEIYNVPEFTKERITINPQVLAKAALSTTETIKAKLDPMVLLNMDSRK